MTRVGKFIQGQSRLLLDYTAYAMAGLFAGFLAGRYPPGVPEWHLTHNVTYLSLSDDPVAIFAMLVFLAATIFGSFKGSAAARKLLTMGIFFLVSFAYGTRSPYDQVPYTAEAEVVDANDYNPAS